MGKAPPWANLVVAALAVLVPLLLGWYRATMHNWPWDGDPARLSICGRDYYPDPAMRDVTAAQMRADGYDLNHLYPVFRAPALIGPQVYSDTSPPRRAAPRQPGEPCSGSLIIEDSPGHYLPYELSGSP
jgi:hypothetical protein